MGGRIEDRAGWASVRDAAPRARREAKTKRRRGRPAGAALAVVALGVTLTLPVGLRAATLAPTGATFTVTSTADAVDANLANGVCAAASGACTLRAAVQQANALAGADTIVLPAGTFELGVPPRNQNLADVGDLDVTDSLTITGAGASATIVDGGAPPAGAPPQVHGLDRLFEVTADGATVALSGLTLRDGWAAEYGGAVLNSSSATVHLVDATLSGNGAGKTGGAVDNHFAGTVEVRDSTLRDNYAVEAGSALNNNRGGTMTVVDSTIVSNSAADGGLDDALVGAGAIANNAELDAVGTLTVSGSVIAENRAGGGRNGAGISNDGAGALVVTDTTFTSNRAVAEGGAIFNLDGSATVTDSTFTENAGNNGGAISSSGQGSLVVVAGVFTKNVAADWGGGVHNGNKGSASIRSSTFTENTGLNGGGFANEGSGLVTVESSTFTKNAAVDTATAVGGEGGGLNSNSGGEVVVTGSVFVENHALSGGGLGNEGGGVLTITGSRFEANRAEESGGGILIQSGDVSMVDLDVLRNSSDSEVEGGGGISYMGDKVVGGGETAALERSRIRDNTSKGPGGGIDSRGDGPLVVLTTSISGNRSVIGGAIHHVGDASLLVTRSTLSGNSAESGGGVFTDGDGEATVENSTISGNRAGQFGGGVLVSSRLILRHATVTANVAPSGGGVNNGGGNLIGDGDVLLANSIVSGNTGGNCAGTVTSRGGNVEGADTCQLRELSDQPGTDPRLGPLAANGGPTLTHALLDGSLAQDRAVCTDVDTCPAVDQRGVARPAFLGHDAGAYESSLEPVGGDSNSVACTGRTERPVLADYDSWISQDNAASNFGRDAVLKVESKSGGNHRALLHFTLPSIPPGCRLVGASLRLYSASATGGRTLDALRLAGPWTEAGVTWANQPATSGSAATTASGLDVREWDVLAQTLEMYDSGAHGFLIRDGVENGSGAQSFHSREKGADRPPELMLVFDDPDDAPVGDCATTPLRLAADRDSWVSQSSPSSNFGTDSTLKIKSQSSSNSRVLLHFPLPTLAAGCTTVEAATLRLEASSAKEGRTLTVSPLAAAWSEAGVTWANQPAAGGPAAATPSADGPLAWNVTAGVLALYGSGNHGFLVRDSSENGVGDEQTLNSRHKIADSPPELELRFSADTPETSFGLAPAATSQSTEATFTFSSDTTDATFECSLDSAAFAACTSPLPLSGLLEGAHVFSVRAQRPIRAVDPTPATHEWKVSIPPETTVFGPGSPSASTSATLRFTADDAAATFECALDAATFETCTSPVELTDLADGSHAFRVQATDALGNVETEPAEHVWTVADPPETTIDSAPDELTRLSSAEFAFTADETGSTFECRLDGGDWLACPSPHSYLGLADGVHTFEARAVDPALNKDPDPASHAWTIDTVAPATMIVSGPSSLTNDSTPRFEFSSEPGASFECALGGDFAACESPLEVTQALADGAHTFAVRASDAAGNAGEAASLAFVVDTQGPTATITAGPSGLTNEPTPEFAFHAEEGVVLECALGGPYVTCTSPYVVIEPLPDGPYSFDLRATDAAGNTGEVASRAFTVDTVGPETTVTAGPSGLSNDSMPTFEFTSEDGATFSCALGAALEPCVSPYAVTTPLADGAYTFEVQATDAAGNAGPPAGVAFTIDTEAPATTIDSGPSGLTNDSAPTFVFSSEEGATFACSLGGAFEACTSPYVATPLADGEHTFRVKARDVVGNVGEVASVAFTVDTQGPATTITEGPAEITNDATPRFAFSSEEGVVFACRVDESAFAACESPHGLVEALGDGDHSFEVRATDAAGNTGDAAGRAFRVDTVGPTVALTGPSGLTNENTPTFTFDAAGASGFECSLGEAPTEACSSPYDVNEPLADGGYRFEVTATDAAGNSGATASLDFTVDTIAPVVTIASGPDHPTTARSAQFTLTADDAGASFACKLDTGDYAPCNSGVTYGGPLSLGDHVLQVNASDGAGNESAPASYSWTIEAPDTTAPVVTVLAGPDNPTTKTSAQFTFSVDDGAASLQCKLDGGDYAPCASGVSYAGPLALGEHLFQVKGTDGAGNDGAPDSYAWTIEAPDTTAPTVTILNGPADPTTATSAQFAFSADDPTATFRCKLDTGAFETCTSGHAYPGPLGLGDHVFQVKGTDGAGNEGAAASHAWTIEQPDSTAPVVTISRGPDDPTTATSAGFDFSADDPAATFQCALDGGVFEPCSSGHDYPGPLALGDHLFEVKATDAADNESAPASYAWTIEARDTTAPTVTISGGPEDPTASRSAQFAFSADDAGATFECKLDAGAFEACTSGHIYPGPLSLGEHVFHVKASDGAGNEGAPDSYEWTIEAPDTTAPAVTISGGPDNPTTARSARFNFSADDAGANFQCRLDGGDYAPCASGVSYDGPLALGEHLVEVKATDAAGNEGAPASYAWTIEAAGLPPDTTAPTLTITSGPASSTATTATFQFAANEPIAAYRCSLDSGPLADCAPGVSYSGLGTGPHTFLVQGTDSAGNVGSATWSWTVGAASSPPSCTPQTLTLGANADGWLLESSPSSNYGQDSALKVDTKAGANARTLVRFPLPATPAGCTLQDVRLRMYAGSSKNGRILLAVPVASSWSQGGVTWSTQPAATGAGVSAPSGAGYVEWNVTALAGGGSGSLSFLIRDATESGTGVEQAFHSLEKGADNPPRLVVKFG